MGLHCPEILFPTSVPHPEAIRKRLGERTGVEIRLDFIPEDNEGVFSSPLFVCACAFYIQDTAVRICMPRSSYLEWSAIATFIEFGGVFDGEVPAWVNRRWADGSWWWQWRHR